MIEAYNPIGVVREREFWLDAHEGEWPELKSGVQCLEDQLCVEMCPPRESFGAIELPETAARRARSHFGVVQSSGVKWLTEGDRVAVRAYKGLHIEPFQAIPGDGRAASLGMRLHPDAVLIEPDIKEFGQIFLAVSDKTHTGVVRAAGASGESLIGERVVFSKYHAKARYSGFSREDYEALETIDGLVVQDIGSVYAMACGYSDFGYTRFFGAGVPIRECIAMVLRDRWRPAPGWMLVSRPRALTQNGIHLTERASVALRSEAVIEATHEPSDIEGMKCALETGENAIRLGLGFEGDLELVRENTVLCAWQ